MNEIINSNLEPVGNFSFQNLLLENICISDFESDLSVFVYMRLILVSGDGNTIALASIMDTVVPVWACAWVH